MILFLFFAVFVQKTSDLVFFSHFPRINMTRVYTVNITRVYTRVYKHIIATRLVEARRIKPRRGEMFVAPNVNWGK